MSYLGFVMREVRGDLDLHAGITSRDDEYFPLEVGESVRVECHVQSEYLDQRIKVQC